MDRFNHNVFGQSIEPPTQSVADFNQRPISARLHTDSRVEAEPKECTVSRKVQKADREKLRRDRLNEQFTELGNTLDPDRPKNDKASILNDTIQVLRDLTTQVDRLKAEYATLTEESRELTQEKNDLKEEKASLKSDIENLNLQYQQRLRAMYPWGGMDPSVVMHPPSYPYPVPMPMAPGPISMHPSLQPYHYFGNQNPALVPNPCSTFVPYLTPNTIIEQQSHNVTHVVPPPSSRSRVSSKQDSRQRSSDHGESKAIVDSDDVATELELKTPGSTVDQDSSSRQQKCKKSARKDSSVSVVFYIIVNGLSNMMTALSLSSPALSLYNHRNLLSQKTRLNTQQLLLTPKAFTPLRGGGLMNIMRQKRGFGGTVCYSAPLSPRNLQWIGTISSAVLMLARGTPIQKSFLVPIFALQAPASIISWIKGEYGVWTAFLALLIRLFFYIPGELELPFIALLIVLVAPYQILNLRGKQEGVILSLAIAGYLAFQHFSRAGSLRKAFDQGSIIATICIICVLAVPCLLLIGF